MTTDNVGPLCPLCSQKHNSPFYKDSKRSYLHCTTCRLVFVPERFRLGREEEKAVYDLHQNSADDPGYRRFLSRLSTPLLERLAPRRTGLDFGCGPGPALSKLIEEHGHRMDLYDPYYYNNPSVFRKKYDFICATEVVEHLHNPARDFSDLFGMLKQNGWLAVMTKLVMGREAFSRWHYIRDMTHICFYSRATFEYLADRFDVGLTFIDNDVILLKKKNPAPPEPRHHLSGGAGTRRSTGSC